MPNTRCTLSRFLVRGALTAQLFACSSAAPVVAPSTVPATLPAAPAEPVCERVKRASRIYTGFRGDVPASRMHVALDVIRPLEERLGQLFCAHALAPCRPPHLTTIMLADDLPSQAQVTVEGGPTAEGESFDIVLRLEGERWQPELSSLAAILAPCGGTGAIL